MLITDSKDKQRDPDPILVLNDQGGSVMNVSDKPSTLRAQMNHHEPIVCYPVISLKGNFIDRDTRQNGIGWNDGNVSYTLDATDRHAVCFQLCSRYTGGTMEWLCAGNGQLHQISMQAMTNTLDCMHDQQMIIGGY